MYLKIAIAAVAFAVGWSAHDYLTQRDHIAQLEATNAATIELQTRADAAQRAATVRERRLSADRARLAAVNNGLRDELAAAERLLPDATCDSVREYAATLGTIYGECRARLSEVGLNAQGHAIDSQKLIDAWPVRNGAADASTDPLDTVAPNQ